MRLLVARLWLLHNSQACVPAAAAPKSATLRLYDLAAAEGLRPSRRTTY